MFSIYNDDCLKVLKEIEDNSVDLICTDPPYKITPRGSKGSMGGYWQNELTKSGKIFQFNDISCSEYLPEFYRILKDTCHCYIMINNLNLIEMLNEATKVGFNFIKCLIWDKGNKICGRYYMGCYEYIVLLRKGGDKPINNCSTPDILSVPIKKLKDRFGNNLHDTEKPVELMKILVENSTKPNEVVLDPFMGGGSTGVASVELKRKFIGVEIDKEYFNISKERLECANIQDPLW